MSKYTIKDVANIVPENLTPKQTQAIEDYLNNGTVPEPDPCISCDANFIRRLISLIQTAERTGMLPPKREEESQAPEQDWAEGGYVAGNISKEELDAIKEKRSNLYGTDDGDDVELG